jgi:4-hydroxy-tetrahydrodipicolinate reductase
MAAYLLRRLLLVIPTLFGIILINFAVVQFAPGGPVEQMLAELKQKKTWVNAEGGTPDQLYIESKRIDPAPGTHTIRYQSAIDTITIEHEAHSREGFALGAVVAAEFLFGKKDVYTMKEVLGLGN